MPLRVMSEFLRGFKALYRKISKNFPTILVNRARDNGTEIESIRYTNLFKGKVFVDYAEAHSSP